ncbi:alpha-D-ribose 1-methylphosphonate 5-triphosphate synthase subunit PhnL [Angulomicrobium tetraedrale]|uniref:Alpha-D-ribose 1-methylphosphonate 5-triphosphate synthase subunit PhnL n=1 Tax=Ancylobacter tetraedralis TaxID=217068 RepID=A0A839Z189_9HYPH|nr:phosphonate C-P lyase system protein PhnL [Ancylobacter tetraedralis]MBB3769442.1 alpha-D-ribose 1-methylphosphonate 5-triphosphate synthase subunit PhnL [Ancylobacter tetraedralis]
MEPLTDAMVCLRGVGKSFTFHSRGLSVEALRGVDLEVRRGECVALDGPSGAGKSTLMRTLYGNYLAGAGTVRVRHGGELINIAGADPHIILEVRRTTLGYISQFLRVLPRVPTLDIVAEPLIAIGTSREAARERAAELLEKLNVAPALWSLPPATFSGGEQQRVNIARGFAVPCPILLLDEPTASLDAANADSVIALIEEARARGTAMIGIFHDAQVKARVATRQLTLTRSS